MEPKFLGWVLASAGLGWRGGWGVGVVTGMGLGDGGRWCRGVVLGGCRWSGEGAGESVCRGVGGRRAVIPPPPPFTYHMNRRCD